MVGITFMTEMESMQSFEIKQQHSITYVQKNGEKERGLHMIEFEKAIIDLYVAAFTVFVCIVSACGLGLLAFGLGLEWQKRDEKKRSD